MRKTNQIQPCFKMGDNISLYTQKERQIEINK